MKKYIGFLIVLSFLFIAPQAKAVTLEELTTQINSLQQQISKLQFSANALQSVNTTPATSSKDVLKRTLKIGSTGADVKSLQEFLIQKGYLLAGNDTGYYGTLTADAVKQYQKTKGIPATGICALQTRTAINLDLATPDSDGGSGEVMGVMGGGGNTLVSGVFTADNFYDAFTSNDLFNNMQQITSDVYGGVYVAEKKDFNLNAEDRVYMAVWDDGLDDEGPLAELTIASNNKILTNSSDWEFTLTDYYTGGYGKNVDYNILKSKLVNATWSTPTEMSKNVKGYSVGPIPGIDTNANWLLITGEKDNQGVAVYRTKEKITIPETLLPQVTLVVDPVEVYKDESAKVKWSTSPNTTSCVSLSGFGIPYKPSYPLFGEYTVKDFPSSALYQYSIICKNSYGSTKATADLIVKDKVIPTVTISADPMVILKGKKTTVTWESENASVCSSYELPLSWNQGNVLKGSKEFTLYADKTYKITCTNSVGQASAEVTVKVVEITKDFPVATISTDKPEYADEQPIITWGCKYSEVYGGKNFSPFPASNKYAGVVVSPAINKDTTFTIQCKHSSGYIVEASRTVKIRPIPSATIANVKRSSKPDANGDYLNNWITLQSDTRFTHAGGGNPLPLNAKNPENVTITGEPFIYIPEYKYDGKTYSFKLPLANGYNSKFPITSECPWTTKKAIPLVSFKRYLVLNGADIKTNSGRPVQHANLWKGATPYFAPGQCMKQI